MTSVSQLTSNTSIAPDAPSTQRDFDARVMSVSQSSSTTSMEEQQCLEICKKYPSSFPQLQSKHKDIIPDRKRAKVFKIENSYSDDIVIFDLSLIHI